MSEAVLHTLRGRAGEFVSGEEMSRMAGVSRTAIWKEIEKLRAEGYKILGEPHAGYRLVAIPDRLTRQELAWNLETRRIGCRIHAYETTNSTMDVAHRLAAAGEPDGTIVVAEGQTKGRGRLGRDWTSPKGKGVYLSAILRPPLQLSEVPLITLMAAVAVARTISGETILKPEIKWPNDVLIRGRKVAGILTELHAELNRVTYVVVGIGLNVTTPKSALPAHATSLMEELRVKPGKPAGEEMGLSRASRLQIARALLVHLDRAYEQFLGRDFDSLLETWRGFASLLGRRIRVVAQGRVVDSQAVDIDSSGALLVRSDSGFTETVSAGDVLVVR